MIDTGRTLTLAAKTLHERGAKAVYALISHGSCLILIRRCFDPHRVFPGLLSETNMSLIDELPIERLVVRFHNLHFTHLSSAD